MHKKNYRTTSIAGSHDFVTQTKRAKLGKPFQFSEDILEFNEEKKGAKAVYNELQMESFGYDSMPTDHRNNSDSHDSKQPAQLALKNDGKVPGYETEDLT